MRYPANVIQILYINMNIFSDWRKFMENRVYHCCLCICYIRRFVYNICQRWSPVVGQNRKQRPEKRCYIDQIVSKRDYHGSLNEAWKISLVLICDICFPYKKSIKFVISFIILIFIILTNITIIIFNFVALSVVWILVKWFHPVVVWLKVNIKQCTLTKFDCILRLPSNL